MSNLTVAQQKCFCNKAKTKPHAEKSPLKINTAVVIVSNISSKFLSNMW